MATRPLTPEQRRKQQALVRLQQEQEPPRRWVQKLRPERWGKKA